MKSVYKVQYDCGMDGWTMSNAHIYVVVSDPLDICDAVRQYLTTTKYEQATLIVRRVSIVGDAHVYDAES